MESFCSHTKWLGRNPEYFKTLDSTNRYAKIMAEEGCPEGYTVYADVQTAGKGSHGRTWFSSTPTGLWFSFVLRPLCSPEQTMCLSMLVSYSIAKTLRKHYGLDVQIKWPNDCYLNGKKLAGILTEAEIKGSKIAYMIIGIGINLYTEDFPEPLNSTATSILKESGIYPDRDLLLEAILSDFEPLYRQYQDTYDLSKIQSAYNQLLIHQNKKINITYDGKKMLTLLCMGIHSDGRLIGQKDDGTIVKLMNGEVSIRS